MAAEAGSGVNLSVYPVLGKVVPTMLERPLRGILVLIACFEFILDGMTVVAESLYMANVADLSVLSGREPVRPGPAGFMVHLRPFVRMALAADGISLDRDWMLLDRGVLSIGHDIQYAQKRGCQNYYFH